MPVSFLQSRRVILQKSSWIVDMTRFCPLRKAWLQVNVDVGYFPPVSLFNMVPVESYA